MILYSVCWENAITLGNSEDRQQKKPRLDNTGSLWFENKRNRQTVLVLKGSYDFQAHQCAGFKL